MFLFSYGDTSNKMLYKGQVRALARIISKVLHDIWVFHWLYNDCEIKRETFFLCDRGNVASFPKPDTM